MHATPQSRPSAVIVIVIRNLRLPHLCALARCARLTMMRITCVVCMFVSVKTIIDRIERMAWHAHVWLVFVRVACLKAAWKRVGCPDVLPHDVIRSYHKDDYNES